MADPTFVAQECHTKWVARDLPRFDQQYQAMALLELVTLGRQEFAEGGFSDAEAFMAEMDSTT